MDIYLACYFALFLMSVMSFSIHRRIWRFARIQKERFEEERRGNLRLASWREASRRGTTLHAAHNPFFILSCLIIIILICFRDVSVGADTLVYARYFSYLKSNQFLVQELLEFNIEPEYILLCKLLTVFGDTQNVFIFTMGLISLLPLFHLIERHSPLPCLSLGIFYTLYFTSAEYLCRFWCALLICLFSCKYVVKRDFLRFALLILLAFLFHRTAVIFLVTYWLYLLPCNFTAIILTFCFSVLSALLSKPVVSFLRLFAREPYEDSGFNGGIHLLILLWLFVLFAFFFGRKGFLTGRPKVYFVMLMFSVIFQPISFAMSKITRITIYFSVAIIFVLPMTIFHQLKQKQNVKYSPAVIAFFWVALLVIYLLYDAQKDFKFMQIKL